MCTERLVDLRQMWIQKTPPAPFTTSFHPTPFTHISASFLRAGGAIWRVVLSQTRTSAGGGYAREGDRDFSLSPGQRCVREFLQDALVQTASRRQERQRRGVTFWTEHKKEMKTNSNIEWLYVGFIQEGCTVFATACRIIPWFWCFFCYFRKNELRECAPGKTVSPIWSLTVIPYI